MLFHDHYDLVDVPDIVAADLRIPSQVFASNPPPQNQVNDVSDKGHYRHSKDIVTTRKPNA